MAQPAPEEDESQPRLRIGKRSYTDDAGPLVEVLVLLHDWALERRGRAKAEEPAAESD